jgi:HEAT repeat protein
MKRIPVFLLLFALLDAQSRQAQIESLLAKIATYQYGADPAPQVRLDELVGRLSGSVHSKQMIEGLLLKFLQSNATPAGKEAAFRQLSLVGSNAAVPVLAPLLVQIDSAEMARYALAAIPGAAADEALRTALGKAPSDRIKIGIVNSLGARRDSKAVAAIAPLSSSSNLELAAAVMAALASISDRPALDALAAARKSANGPAREMAAEAMVVCAGNFAVRGDKATAASVYKQLLGPAEPANVRTRALKNLATADPNAAISALAAELQSKDTLRQVDAVRILHGIPGAAAAKTMIAAYPTLPPVGQVHVLTAVGFRGEAAGKSIAASAATASDRAVRAAGLAALGRLGDASSIKTLAEAAAAGQEPEASAARQSLVLLKGASADAAIVSALGNSTGKVKSELILAAGERASTSAAGALVKAAGESDPEIRREALRALRNAGGSAQVPALLDLVLKSSSSSERREAALTLAAMLKRAQAPVAPVIAAFNNTPAKEARLSLIDVMGQTSAQDALPVLRNLMKDSDAEVARAAILALTAWDNSAPIPDLMALAKSAQRPAAPTSADLPSPGVGRGGSQSGGQGRGGQGGAPGSGFGGGGGRGMAPPTNNLQVLALRGVLRLMVLQSQRTPAENGQMLADVMSLSTQIAEKRAVLGLLPSFPSQESLRVAQAATKDDTLKNEALVAVAQVTEALKVK